MSGSRKGDMGAHQGSEHWARVAWWLVTEGVCEPDSLDISEPYCIADGNTRKRSLRKISL